MATAPSLPFVPVEEYLRTSYEPYCEYIDGVLEPKALPDRTHSRLQGLLVSLLIALEEKYGFEVYPELHIRTAPSRFRIPDVCALLSRPQDDRYAEQPPLLTVEIVSKDEPWQKLRAKIADHQRMGVSLVIVADPYNKTVMVARQDAPLQEIVEPLIVSVTVPDRGVLQIDFDELFRKSGF
jgi:Uma2 family endonuclease